MENSERVEWLVDIFVEYQEALDKRRKAFGGRQWLADALESDRNDRVRAFDTASTISA